MGRGMEGVGGGVRCHMSRSGRPFVPGPACLFSLSSEDGFTRRRLAQMAGRTRRAGGRTHSSEDAR